MHRNVAGPTISALIALGIILYIVGQALTQEAKIQQLAATDPATAMPPQGMVRGAMWCNSLSYLSFIVAALIALMCLCGGCGGTVRMADAIEDEAAGEWGEDQAGEEGDY